MSKDQDLDSLVSTDIYKGVPNSKRIGDVYYNSEGIRRVRETSPGNKAPIRRGYVFKMLAQTIIVAGMALTALTIIGLYTIGYTGLRDETYRNREDQYVSNLGTIIKNYSEEDVINLANMTIEKIKTGHGPQEKIDYLNANLKKIADLKSQGMANQIGQYLANICSIASDEGFFLPGYDYTVPSFPEYLVEDILSPK